MISLSAVSCWVFVLFLYFCFTSLTFSVSPHPHHHHYFGRIFKSLTFQWQRHRNASQSKKFINACQRNAVIIFVCSERGRDRIEVKKVSSASIHPFITYSTWRTVVLELQKKIRTSEERNQTQKRFLWRQASSYCHRSNGRRAAISTLPVYLSFSPHCEFLFLFWPVPKNKNIFGFFGFFKSTSTTTTTATTSSKCLSASRSRFSTRQRATSSPARRTLVRSIAESWSRRKTTWTVRWRTLPSLTGTAGWPSWRTSSSAGQRFAFLYCRTCWRMRRCSRRWRRRGEEAVEEVGPIRRAEESQPYCGRKVRGFDKDFVVVLIWLFLSTVARGRGRSVVQRAIIHRRKLNWFVLWI